MNQTDVEGSRYDTDLVNLAKRSLLKEGDLVVYRRHFASLGLIIHKELLVKNISLSRSTIHSFSQ